MRLFYESNRRHNANYTVASFTRFEFNLALFPLRTFVFHSRISMAAIMKSRTDQIYHFIFILSLVIVTDTRKVINVDVGSFRSRTSHENADTVERQLKCKKRQGNRI
jgi:hypothetical protein